MIKSDLHGDSIAIGRDLSEMDILVEMSYAPPLGTQVVVGFVHPTGDDDGSGALEVRAVVTYVARGNVRVATLRFMGLVVADDYRPPYPFWH